MADNQQNVTLQIGDSTAICNLFGATITSWKPRGTEVLFVSEKSYFDNERPIRGGIPVIFPQFGPWKLGPQHGFARRTKWKLKDGPSMGDNCSKMTCVLEDSEATRKLWDYKFRFEYTVSLLKDSGLKMEVYIENKDEKEFDFTFLLHTYFSVPDVNDCIISGLKGCNYIDKVRNGVNCVEENEGVKISEFTDRVYRATPDVIKISNASANRTVAVVKINLPDTVVWNPWSENAKKMADFGDDEWRKMVCVEAGHVGSAYVLKPGASYRACQTLSVV